MHVIITGGTGRLGRSVTSALQTHGYDVTTVDIGSAGSDVPHFRADLADAGQAYAALKQTRADFVVHAAAMTDLSAGPQQELFGNNVRSTFNVFQAAAELQLGGVVYIGSPNPLGYEVADWRPEYLPIDERHPFRETNAYNLSKSTGERIMDAFARRGLATTSIRPGFVIAPEEWCGGPGQGGKPISDRLNDPDEGVKSLFNYVDARDAAELVRLGVDALKGRDLETGRVFFGIASDALAREPLSALIPRYFPGTDGIAAKLGPHSSAFTCDAATAALGWSATRSWRTELQQ